MRARKKDNGENVGSPVVAQLSTALPLWDTYLANHLNATMNNADSPSGHDSHWAKRLRIDEICDDLESPWRSEGPPPDLRAFVQECDFDQESDKYSELLLELVSLDREYRQRADLVTDSTHYCDQFPGSAELIAQIFSGEALTLRTIAGPESGVMRQAKTFPANDTTIDSAEIGEGSIPLSGNRIR